jgi:hypothetical protein
METFFQLYCDTCLSSYSCVVTGFRHVEEQCLLRAYLYKYCHTEQREMCVHVCVCAHVHMFMYVCVCVYQFEE